jgi:uncharacterized alpha-E superfamily protein
MLSRVAESVYWIGRYVERAENTARLLDVAFRSTRELSSSFQEGAPDELRLVLAALGTEDVYAQRYGDITEDGLAAFLVVDADNPHSVVRCITAARDNARAVRESISTEMWEELNRTYLSLSRVTTAYLLVEGVYDFCRQIRLASQLFHGVTDATMAYDEAWHFIQVGKYLERAGMTARILHARGGELQATGAISRPEDVHRWLGLLRSVSAYEAYMRLKPGGVQPAQVAEFLLLSQQFPRSVAFGVRRVFEEIGAIDRELGLVRQGGPGVPAGALASRLLYTTFDELGGGRLQPFIDTVSDQCNAIADGIRRVYFEGAAVGAM